MTKKLSAETIAERETYRCAHCGKWTGRDDEPFYSLEDMRDDCAPVLPFCSEAHADAYHTKRGTPLTQP
jgi:endogenous inhibitor of DNA gyrase (YacG/DUF329 family)